MNLPAFPECSPGVFFDQGFREEVAAQMQARKTAAQAARAAVADALYELSEPIEAEARS